MRLILSALKKVSPAILFCMVVICCADRKEDQICIIQRVNVIPMNEEVVLKDRDVTIKNGMIAAISTEGERVQVDDPKTVVINGAGKYLMPGLMDMHAHFFSEQGLDTSYLPFETKVMLANGVTTARIMAGHPAYKNLRDRIQKNEVIGPELFVMSPQLVGGWDSTAFPNFKILKTPEQAVQTIRLFKQEGYDGVKIAFFLKPDVYEAIVKTAKEVGLKITGHIGKDVKLPAALAAKQQVEHLDEFLEMLLPEGAPNKGVSISGTSIWNPKAWETVDLLDESKIPALVTMIKEAGIYNTPTSFFLESSFGTGFSDEWIDQSPDKQFIPDSILQDRYRIRDRFWKNPPGEARRKKMVSLRQKIVKALNDSGCMLLCGSDSPEWFIVYGFSVHYELQKLTESGLSPYDALRTATVNPAKWLDIADRKGTITAGRQADLLLLDANPLDNISNTQKINAVIQGGTLYQKAALDNMLKEVRDKWKGIYQ